ncbi:EpsG family protein [Prevotella copri]|uniref:EpsG family protein n=1 Tax=Segatella copri TaxID=165179 RepID=UPI001F411ABE|nr:EpsG family protein [Segatella copri]MCF2611241.1 EpsG family protein [Segatella copri]
MLADFYQSVYLIVVFVLTGLVCYLYYSKNGDLSVEYSEMRVSVSQNFLCLLLLLFMILFIGTRPVSERYFGDMAGYFYEYRLFEEKAFGFDESLDDPLWSNMMRFFASCKIGFTSFMLLVAVLYFYVAYKSVGRMFPSDKLAAYLVFLGAFSTFSYGTNGMRAGVAASIFLLALSYAGNWLITITLAVLSLFIHHSMVLPLFAFFLALAYRKTNVYLCIWLVCILISAFHITWFQDLFSQLSADNGDARGAQYLMVSGKGGYRTGFRLDFILYSSVPIVVSYFAVIIKKIQSDYYCFLINIYIITNSIWMLCMYASYSNRIAYLSWFMYPIVLIYPFLNEDWGFHRYRVFSIVMFVHVCFTLAMHFVFL